jgi:hypothetical protein
MTIPGGPTPDWDLEQLEVIMELPERWQLVEAGPGSGKSAVACQRVAYLIDEGVPPSRILLISFTRTAVAELRDRIVRYAAARTNAKGVRISTIDSHAWSLRTGFDDDPLPHSIGDGSFDLSISRTVEMFQEGNPDLLDFMARLEHLVIDEAQDIMSIRAELVLEMLRTLSANAGVTILADPAQAIYGFTADDGDDAAPGGDLLTRLTSACPRPLLRRVLKHNHRAQQVSLGELFLRAREQAQAIDPVGHVARVQEVIRTACGADMGAQSYENIAEFLADKRDESTFVLFRRRADVLMASSFCSEAGLSHRLRLSSLPLVVRPWIGWLLGETCQALIMKEEFDCLWEVRVNAAPALFLSLTRDEAWMLLHRLAAGRLTETVDLEVFRRIVARPRPPIELCSPDVGFGGPILGTIHASKGREADTVVLVLAAPFDASEEEGDDVASAVLEEGRVYYVGATRARKALVTADSATAGVRYLDSRRVYRSLRTHKAQLEVGRNGDVDNLAHLAWTNAIDVQRLLASFVTKSIPLRAISQKENSYAFRLSVDQVDDDGVTRTSEIGQLSKEFDYEWKELWGQIDTEQKLRPPSAIPHLHLVDVTTIGIPEEHRWAVKHPFKLSGLALAPIIKGLPLIQFLYRNRRRSYQ